MKILLNDQAQHFKNSIIVGVLAGIIMGFIDTYGYCVTGYTTSEISLIIIPIIVYTIFKLFNRRPSLTEIIISTVLAFGMTLTSAITSGMYVTYTLLNNLPIAERLGISIPEWLYYNERGLNLSESVINYSILALISASGAILAYVFYKHYIEKERLLYPIGTTSAFMMSTITLKFLKSLMVPFIIGFFTQTLTLFFGPFFYDLTPSLQPIIPGIALSIGIDFFMLYLAFIMPLNTTLGISLGNALMYLVIFPILAFQGFLLIKPGIDANTLVISSTPYISSFVVGFILLSIIWYLAINYKPYITTFKVLFSYNVNKVLLTFSLLLLSSQVIMALVYDESLFLLHFIPIFIAIILMQFMLVLVNMRVVGEVGLGSQAIFPIATSLIYVSGYKGATLYIFSDPFTGIPMPQYFAGSAMNVIKTSRLLDVDTETVILLLLLGIAIGAPLTLIYGHALLSAYGIFSKHFSLVRWLPITYWMAALYGRAAMEVFNSSVVVTGIITSIVLLTLLKVLKLSQISLFAVLIGLILTPDLLITFIIASLIKYVATRLGTEIQENLIMFAALALAGAGMAIIIHTSINLVIP